MAIYVCRRVSESMKPSSFKLCLIFLLGIFVANTESNVSIEVHGLSDTNGSYSCNTLAVLTCKITGYTDSMEWRIDGELKSDCFVTDCYSYPPFPGNYSFTNDIEPNDISIFNVTINPLTLSDRGKSFVCRAESLSDSVTLQVTAKNDDYDISYTDNQSLPYMEASSGCFSSDTKVKFIWRKIKDITNETSVYENDDEDELPCTPSVCIESGRIKRQSTLRIQEDKYGDRFRFQVEVKYENASHINAVYDFGTTYILKGTTNLPSITTQTTYNTNTTISTAELDTKKTSLTYKDTSIGQTNTTVVYSEEPKGHTQIIVFILAGSSVVVIIIVVMLIYVRFLKRKKKSLSSKCQANAEEQDMTSVQL